LPTFFAELAKSSDPPTAQAVDAVNDAVEKPQFPTTPQLVVEAVLKADAEAQGRVGVVDAGKMPDAAVAALSLVYNQAAVGRAVKARP